MIRTTVRLDDEVFKEARKKAIDQRLSFASILNEALKAYLKKPKKETRRQFKLKIYDMGQIKGSLSRTEIYADI